MAGPAQDSTSRCPRRLQIACLVMLAWASLSSAAPTGVKQGLLDKVVYVSDDPAVKKWRQELSGVGIYPAHYALKALDLLPLPRTPVSYLTVRRSLVEKRDHTTNEEEIESRSLESRRRKKNKGGHDDHGYDDGSWRGNNGDYGLKKEKGDEAENSDYQGLEEESDGDRHSFGGHEEDYSSGGGISDETAGEDTGNYSSQSQDSTFQPYTEKAKYKSTTDEDPYASSGTSWRAPGKTAPSDGDPSYVGNEGSKSEQTEEDYGEDTKGGESGDSYTSSDDSTSSDCTSLRRLFDDMGGHEWIDSTGWAAESSRSKTCCRAFGVSCNMAGRVTALDLGANGLSGPLSPAIFEVRYLTRL